MDEESKLKLFKEIKSYSDQLRKDHAERVKICGYIDDMYLMRKTPFEDALEKIADEVVVVKSPDEHIAVQSVVRILTKTVPKVKMARAKNKAIDHDKADMIEDGANAILSSSDRVNRRPLHYDAVLGAVLHDLLTIEATCTEDHLNRLDEEDEERKMKQLDPIPQARRERVKRFVEAAPYVLSLLRATDTFPFWDFYGLKGVLNVSKVQVREILDFYGYKAAEAIKQTISASYLLKPLEVWDYKDDQYRAVWINETMIVMEEHERPFLNIVSSIIEGSHLFEKIEDQYSPFLLGVHKSGLHNRKTEALTAKYSNNRALGFSPLHVYKRGPNNEAPSQPTQVGMTQLWDIPYGADLMLVSNKGLLDPAVQEGLVYAERKTEEMTIYKTVVGESQSETYSQTALLSQLARIPLETTKNMVGRTIADALEIVFKWIKINDKNVPVYDYNKGALADIIVEDIPEYFNLDCNLDVALPQDELQQANTASILVKSEIGSTEWIQENVLKIESPKEMYKQIVREKYRNARIEYAIAKKIREMQMQDELQMQQMLQAAMPQQGLPPGTEGGVVAPAAPAPAPGGTETPGTTMGLAPGAMPGIPPEMLAGGAQGPRSRPGEEVVA